MNLNSMKVVVWWKNGMAINKLQKEPICAHVINFVVFSCVIDWTHLRKAPLVAIH